jgi:hypothetical protein
MAPTQKKEVNKVFFCATRRTRYASLACLDILYITLACIAAEYFFYTNVIDLSMQRYRFHDHNCLIRDEEKKIRQL